MGAQGDALFSKADYMRRLRNIERDIAMVRGERRLEHSSIHRGGIRIADEGSIRSTNFDGDPANVLGDPGENGWALGPDGLVAHNGVFRAEVRSANFEAGESGYQLKPNGNAEFNSLVLRSGIINPEALESPVDFSADSVFGQFDLTTTETEFLSATATIPTYATVAVILAICFMELNPSGDQVLHVRNGISGPGFSGSTLGRDHGHTGLEASVTVPKSVQREDSEAFPIGGATVTATLDAKVNTGTSSSNFATLDLLVLAGRPPSE